MCLSSQGYWTISEQYDTFLKRYALCKFTFYLLTYYTWSVRSLTSHLTNWTTGSCSSRQETHALVATYCLCNLLPGVTITPDYRVATPVEIRVHGLIAALQSSSTFCRTSRHCFDKTMVFPQVV